jgi:hypothetical protein
MRGLVAPQNTSASHSPWQDDLYSTLFILVKKEHPATFLQPDVSIMDINP